MREIRFVFGYTTLSMVSLFSIISCIYVCLSLLLNGYSPWKSNNNYQYKYSFMIIIDIIFWICITDIILGLRCLLMFVPQIFVDANHWFYDGYNGIMCQILAIGDIFFRIQNALWHIILAYNFLYILRMKSFEKILKNQKKYHYCICIIVKLVSMFFDGIVFV